MIRPGYTWLSLYGENLVGLPCRVCWYGEWWAGVVIRIEQVHVVVATEEFGECWVNNNKMEFLTHSSSGVLIRTLQIQWLRRHS